MIPAFGENYGFKLKELGVGVLRKDCWATGDHTCRFYVKPDQLAE